MFEGLLGVGFVGFVVGFEGLVLELVMVVALGSFTSGSVVLVELVGLLGVDGLDVVSFVVVLF